MFFPVGVYCKTCHFDLDVTNRIVSYDSSVNKWPSCVSTACSCVITAPPEHYIRLEFYFFQVSHYPGNMQDWLGVSFGNITSNSRLSWFTRSWLPNTVKSIDRFMMILLYRHAKSRSVFKGYYNYSTTKGDRSICLLS